MRPNLNHVIETLIAGIKSPVCVVGPDKDKIVFSVSHPFRVLQAIYSQHEVVLIDRLGDFTAKMPDRKFTQASAPAGKTMFSLRLYTSDNSFFFEDGGLEGEFAEGRLYERLFMVFSEDDLPKVMATLSLLM